MIRPAERFFSRDISSIADDIFKKRTGMIL